MSFCGNCKVCTDMNNFFSPRAPFLSLLYCTYIFLLPSQALERERSVHLLYHPRQAPPLFLLAPKMRRGLSPPVDSIPPPPSSYPHLLPTPLSPLFCYLAPPSPSPRLLSSARPFLSSASSSLFTPALSPIGGLFYGGDERMPYPRSHTSLLFPLEDSKQRKCEFATSANMEV